MFSAETSNHTLIPALLNLLQRRNSRGPTPPPPGGGPPASYQRARSASFLRNLTSGDAMPWVTVHDETLYTRFGIRDTITDMAKADRKREVTLDRRELEAAGKTTSKAGKIGTLDLYALPLYHTHVSFKTFAPKINFSND